MSIAVETPPTPNTELERIPRLVRELRAAFDSGKTRPLTWRREQLAGLVAMLREHGDDLVAAIQADFGKPTLEAWAADIGSVKVEASLARKHLKAWTKPQRVWTPLSQRPAKARLVHEPLGVVLIIAPWNYPVQLLLSPLVGAIAAGNCAMLKPSEVTARTSEALARFVPGYLDPECVTLVEGGVPETTALLEQRFDHIFYTGNSIVARTVM